MEALLDQTPTLTLASHYAPKHGGAGDAASSAASSGEPDGPQGGKKSDRALRILLIAAIALVLGAYAVGVYVFANYCYPGTTILDVDLSLLDTATAAERLEQRASSYSLTITGGDFSYTYTPGSVEEVLDADAVTQTIVDGNDPLAWPLHLYESLSGQRDLDAIFAEATADDLPDAFDFAAFQETLTAAVEEYNAERSGTFDPQSAYDSGTGTFTVEQALSNRKLEAETVVEAAALAVAQLTAELELGDDAFQSYASDATEEELQTVCDAANALIGATLTFTLGESEVATLDSDTLFDWITFNDDLTASLDTEALTTWATELAESLDTVGTSRTYTRPDGEEITISGGTWGWEVDVDSFVTAVQEAVAAGETATVAIPTTSEADVFTAQGEADWGAYIDVDISEQMARYYDEDGNIVWESGVITGNTTKGNGTPTGVYYINAKYKDITLRGGYDEETEEYGWETDVSYWMAFVGSSVGFHDATWQSSSNFGKAGANTWTGSHGCVNLPLSAAEELYDLVYIGLCVIVHD